MINNSILEGRLVSDVDLKTTGSGTPVAQFRLAVNRPFKNKSGEYEADFINCVIWRKAAENLANFCSKGSHINVQGRLQSRSYENPEGNRIYVTELVVEQFSLLDKKPSGATNTNQAPSTKQSNYQQNQQQDQDKKFVDPFADDGSTIDISDSDLPF